MNRANLSHARFQSTSWSIVTKSGAGEEGRAALNTLCLQYWAPIYAWLRRDGRSPEEAADITQSFFGRLIERSDFSQIVPERGRFRSYLLQALKNFLVNQREYDGAAKRGGGKVVFSIDSMEAETNYLYEPVDQVTPDLLFERRWANAILKGAINELRRYEVAKGREDLFDALRGLISVMPAPGRLQMIADETGKERVAIKVALHRLRQRFADFVRLQIGQTVENPSEINDELDRLLEVL